MATKAYYAINKVFPDKEDAIIIELIRQKLLPNVTMYVPFLVKKEKLTDYWLRKTNKTYNESDKSDDKKSDDQTDDDSDSDPWSKGKEDVTFWSRLYGKSKKNSHPHPAFDRRTK